MSSWVTAAGPCDARYTASAWNSADPETCRWWGQGQASRLLGPTLARQASEQGVTSVDLERIVAGWRTWGDAPEAWFAILHGELLAQVRHWRDPPAGGLGCLSGVVGAWDGSASRGHEAPATQLSGGRCLWVNRECRSTRAPRCARCTRPVGGRRGAWPAQADVAVEGQLAELVGTAQPARPHVAPPAVDARIRAAPGAEGRWASPGR
jgi:hypothetical protein